MMGTRWPKEEYELYANAPYRCGPDNEPAAEPSAEAMDMARVWMQSSGRGEPYERRLASMFDHFAAKAVAAERERIARRVSEQQILRFQVGRDPLVEVNEIIQDLAHDIATDWEDCE